MPLLKLCRFEIGSASGVRLGLVGDDGTVSDLTSAGAQRLQDVLEQADPVDELARLSREGSARYPLEDVRLLTPVESQEVWAAGVTYLRSRQARIDESDFSARAYEHVYGAVRPEIFFKALPHKVVAAGDAVGIRRDA